MKYSPLVPVNNNLIGSHDALCHPTRSNSKTDQNPAAWK